MWGTFHTCPRMLRVRSTHTGRTRIAPGRCTERHPPTRTPRCWCCSCNSAPPSRSHSGTRRSRTRRGLREQRHSSESVEKAGRIHQSRGSLTCAELPAEASARVIVTLAVGAVDVSEVGCVTHTLAAVALSLSAANLGLVVGKAAPQQSAFLAAFTLCPREARLAHAHPTVESPLAVCAPATVCSRR